jgi:hypothetical protein
LCSKQEARVTTTLIDEEPAQDPLRCVAVIDEALPIGHAANAAAVMALTMGKQQPHLVGEPLIDAAGNVHPGLIPTGIPVLGAPGTDLALLREKALQARLQVVDFPAYGQQTTDYAAFRRMMSDAAPAQIPYVGLMLYGPRKKIARIVGRYGLLKASAAD